MSIGLNKIISSCFFNSQICTLLVSLQWPNTKPYFMQEHLSILYTLSHHICLRDSSKSKCGESRYCQITVIVWIWNCMAVYQCYSIRVTLFKRIPVRFPIPETWGKLMNNAYYFIMQCYLLGAIVCKRENCVCNHAFVLWFQEQSGSAVIQVSYLLWKCIILKWDCRHVVCVFEHSRHEGPGRWSKDI